MNLKNWKTQKLENIVSTAVKQMAQFKEATNIKLLEGYRHKIGAFGTHNCWTEVEAVYKNDDGKEVGRVKTIDRIGGWQYSDPSNYILYQMGLYKPYNTDDLKSIKQRYESDLNMGHIYPINEIYSNQYLMDLKVKESIFTTTEVNLTFKLDYDSDLWGTKWTKPCDYRIILDDFVTEPLTEYDAYFLFIKTYEQLTENGLIVNVDFDMKEEHKQRLTHWRWDNIPF